MVMGTIVVRAEMNYLLESIYLMDRCQTHLVQLNMDEHIYVYRQPRVCGAQRVLHGASEP